MLFGASNNLPKTFEDLVGSGLAARLDRMDLLSRKMLAGTLPGERRSKRRGRSVEFDDFRNYVPGDDPRHIDWNVLARLDKLFIKVFREEEDLALHLIIDASASMNVGEPNKLVYAHRLAMALAYVGLVNHNRVSVGVVGGAAGPRSLAPVRGRTQTQRVAAFVLESLNAASRSPVASGAPGGFADAVRTLTASRAGRGVVVLVSDFMQPEGAERAIDYLGAASLPGMVDAYCIQTLTPGELDPRVELERGVVGDLRLIDVETQAAAEVTVTPVTIARYRAELQGSIDALRASCMARGVAHVLVPTDTPVDELVVSTLRRGGMLR